MSQLNVETIDLAGQQYYAETVFPLVFGAQKQAEKTVIAEGIGEGAGEGAGEGIREWIAEHRDRIEEQLAVTGAILFRGFGLVDDRDFDDFIRAFNWANFTYAESLSNAVRRNRTELVFTANEAPPTVSIFLHHEMAQTPVYPSKLFFFCEQAAESGGATPICRSDILLQQLRQQLPAFVTDCENKGVRYSQTMPLVEDLASGQGRSWQSTLSAENRQQAERKLENLNYDWQWQEDGSLSVTTPVLPAVRHLDNGRSVFFNQLIAAFRGWKDARNSGEKSICFGDGSAIDSNHMALAIELADQLTFDIPWQSGDVVVLDNFLVMHGRRPFQGKRAVLASLVA